MNPEQDPFAVFEDQAVEEMGQPKKKVHVDPMAQL